MSSETWPRGPSSCLIPTRSVNYLSAVPGWHASVHVSAGTSTCIHSCTSSCRDMYLHTHAHTPAQACMRAHTHTHTHTHTVHTHTHTHNTHTHTHTLTHTELTRVMNRVIQTERQTFPTFLCFGNSPSAAPHHSRPPSRPSRESRNDCTVTPTGVSEIKHLTTLDYANRHHVVVAKIINTFSSSSLLGRQQNWTWIPITLLN